MASAVSPPSPALRRRWWRSGYAMWVVLVLVMIAAFVPPYLNVNRYRQRVVHAISRALGRDVTASNIEMRLLPRPGLILSGFVVADDPSYSPEPMLRADTVTAYIRLTSLWRARLEIATLELESPSLNLVRRADGHWNLEELVQRTAVVPSAPTAAPRPESRPRFPYVEATAGRINFKLGQVKKAFAFTDADFALWLESENEWGVRLEAKPIRTDVALSDTGMLKLDGSFQRASELRKTPVSLKINFTKGQLGQITKLIYGRDRGWRGGAAATATLSGMPAALAVVLDAQVDDFRRYDIALGEALRLAVHCTGTYSSPDDSLSDAVCEAPIKPGSLRVSGTARSWGAESYDIAISAEQIPMERVIAFARHAKKDLPVDLTATGQADGVFEVRKSDGAAPVWSGGGSTRQFALHSGVLKNDVQIGEMQFAIPGGEVGTAPKRNARKPVQPPTYAGFMLVVKPFAVPLGAASPAVASGFFDDDIFRATVSGNAELTRLTEVARALGIGIPGIGLAGNAEVELELSGSWAGFAPAGAAGSMNLHNATAELQGVNEPLQIASATATLADQSVKVTSFSGSFAGGPVLNGSAGFPVHCTAPESCVVRFDLHTNELTLARVNQLLNPSFASQPWYHLLAIGQRRDALLKLRADGTFAVAHLQIGTLPASNVAGELRMDAGNVQLDVQRSELLGGHHTGRWVSDFTQSPPHFVGGGTFQKIAMEQLSNLMHDSWAAGPISGKYALTLQGATPSALRDSASGSLDFTWSGGSLRHVALENHAAPLTFSNLNGILELRKGKFLLSNAKLQAGGAVYDVNGSAAFDRKLDFRLQGAGGHSYTVSGSLEKPQVEALPSPAAEANLR